MANAGSNALEALKVTDDITDEVTASTPPETDWSAVFARRVDQFCQQLAGYLPADQVDRVRAACQFGAEAHAGVYRKTGERYIFHPVAVAEILTEVRFDHETIIAAVLHDVIEDTPVSKEQIAERFGTEVADLVDGVSKLTQIDFSSRLEAQAENFRKMFLAMAKDIRVIMIKLADRLHNMRTLGAMPAEKRRRIAKETLEIYAPIALRLGMNYLRLELEDLGFRNLHPWRYRVLQAALTQHTAGRREQLKQIEIRVHARLQEENINARVSRREKPLWGVYNAMRSRRLRLREINNLYAIRVIVDEVDTCYRVLGYLHGLYKPVMGRFEDYIAIPRANGYQSLHTQLFGPQGIALEAQILTYDMYVMAQTGVAARWLKADQGEETGQIPNRAREWLQKLLDIQRRAGNSVEFLESVKLDLFPNEIYVFTPTGEIVELPGGATAVDFAYAIHSDVGNTCVGAKVNHRFVPRRTKLSSGQTVEVIISPTARPDPAWLGFVITAKARASIRHYLNHLRRDDAIILGRRLLDKALPGDAGFLKAVTAETLAKTAQQLNATSFDDILADIGLGKRLAPIVAKHLLGAAELLPADKRGGDGGGQQPLLIKGTEGAVISFAKCCRPIPGDTIIAYLSAGRGVVIHRDSCKNVAEYDRAPDKWLEVEWEKGAKATFKTGLRLVLNNRRGVLATVAVALSEANANIEDINTRESDTATTIVDIVVNIDDRSHLAQVFRQLRAIPGVLRIQRRN